MALSTSTRQSLPWIFLLLLLVTKIHAQGLIENQPNEGNIVIDGFVDTKVCYQHLVEADANGNNDGKLQADEYLQFAQSQTPSGELGQIPNYQSMPLVMQATFVTLTCLCRDERFGGDPRDVNCCLGVDAHIALVGNDDLSTSQERTRLFATCFLTDQAIQQVLGSEPPSVQPTNMPSFPPTPSPTFAPTDEPTIPPTTSAPTTSAPTTSAPTLVPTNTEAPTTPRPTAGGPTIAPTSAAPTSVAPTGSPTGEPTTSPLLQTPAQAVYTIAVENGAVEEIDPSEYEPDLIAAMDQLATQVVEEVFATSKRRSLEVMIELPTSIAQYEATNCTVELVEPSDRCENVQHVVTLLDSSELTQTQVQDFEAALIAAITRGELQANLPSTSIVTILTGMTIPSPNPNVGEPLVPQVDSGLSGAATAGIVIASLAVVTVLPLCFYVAMRNNHEAKQPYGGYEPHDAGSDGALEPEMDIEATAAAASKGMTPKAAAAASIGTGTLGASPGDYGKTDYRVKDVSVSSSSHSSSQQQPIKQVQKVPPLTPERDGPPTPRSYDDSSSNAGSSGWSSSAGLSSLNTGSAEDSMDLLNSPQGATLAAIGAASAVVRKMDNRRKITVGGGIEELEVPPGAVSRNDLDNAIEAGDWAAVGATAALLAAASDSQSASSKSRTSRASRSQATSVSSVDAARAAELDHLVDAGDWEGVVLAAAKFEAQEGSVRSGTASSVRSSSAGSETRSGTGSGTFTPSVSTSVSESASKAQKRQEIRAQVEALVRRVVPEELDNVDEMMLQFKGREEELVETLRTMQERAVAQKARSAGHKAAKQEARRTVQRGGIPPPVIPPSAAPASTAPTSTSRDVQSSSGGGSDTTGSQQRRTALEQAIEAGDWEAVGEAAALMSDASMASGSTAEVERLAASARLGAGIGASSGPSLRLAGVNTDRARELDEMIDRGDWSGVVEAAGRFNQADKEASSHSSKASRARESDDADLTAKRNKQLKEEEDALAQAEIWMQIAQQSKVPGATDAAASDAADWAIARSLKSLKKAEQQSSGSMSGGGHKGDSDQAGADDDESV